MENDQRQARSEGGLFRRGCIYHEVKYLGLKPKKSGVIIYAQPLDRCLAGLMQLIGSDRGDLAAPFSLRQPLHRPSGHASGFLD